MSFYILSSTLMGFLVNLLVTAVAVGIAAYVLPGVTVDGLIATIIVALLLGLANATVGRLLRVITAPINWITLGLMSLVIGVLMILLVDNVYAGFQVDGFWTAVIFAIIVGLVQIILNKFHKFD